MIELPSLDLAQWVRLTREGGVAYIAAQAGPRSINLATCPPGVRQEVCDALQQAAPLATPDCAARGGDQRYFHIEIVFESTAGEEAASISFDVPETDTPAPLMRLWKIDAKPV